MIRALSTVEQPARRGRRKARLVLGSWGNTMRNAVRNKERCNGRRTPTQDPSTNKLDALNMAGVPECQLVDLIALGAHEAHGLQQPTRDGQWYNQDDAAHHWVLILALWTSHRDAEPDSASRGRFLFSFLFFFFQNLLLSVASTW